MKIKHSKYKNTGLIYELLVKQVTSDLISRQESPAIPILRKYFSGNNVLVREHTLYKTLCEVTNLSTNKADYLLGEVRRAASRLNLKELKDLKYNLISEIKQGYDLNQFFGATVSNYRTLAAVYCILEADRSLEPVEPESIVANKITLLESMTGKMVLEPEDNLRKTLKEFAGYDRDLRLTTFKILLEKFNEEFKGLLPEQKNLLKQIVALGSTKGLRGYLNEEIAKLKDTLTEMSSRIPGGIERIKLQEAIKLLEPLGESEKVTDSHLVRMLQFYDLQNELTKLWE